MGNSQPCECKAQQAFILRTSLLRSRKGGSTTNVARGPSFQRWKPDRLFLSLALPEELSHRLYFLLLCEIACGTRCNNTQICPYRSTAAKPLLRRGRRAARGPFERQPRTRPNSSQQQQWRRAARTPPQARMRLRPQRASQRQPTPLPGCNPRSGSASNALLLAGAAASHRESPPIVVRR